MKLARKTRTHLKSYMSCEEDVRDKIESNQIQKKPSARVHRNHSLYWSGGGEFGGPLLLFSSFTKLKSNLSLTFYNLEIKQD